MSILSYYELQNLLRDGVVEGSDPTMVNGSSIDVRLGSEILVERKPQWVTAPKVLSLRERDSMSVHKLDISEQAFQLYPGEFVLAHTMESFNLPLDTSAEFRLKSSVARMGLSHALAVWCDPGWYGSTLTLELHNISQHHAIEMRAFDKIGQMVFHKHEPVPESASYARTGAYNNDAGASVTKPEKS